MTVLGFIISSISLYYAYRYYDVIANGVKREAVVTEIIREPTTDGYKYGIEVSYTADGATHTYQPSYRVSHQTHKEGDILTMYQSPEGLVLIEFYALLGVGLGVIFGLLFFIGGLVWMIKHIHRYDKNVRLKRYGKKVTARYIRSEETSYEINNRVGTILYFKQERGDRIFRTHPIFSTFSIVWLEEHIFDVYIDPQNPDDYYVDLEKHFGEPTRHVR